MEEINYRQPGHPKSTRFAGWPRLPNSGNSNHMRAACAAADDTGEFDAIGQRSDRPGDRRALRWTSSGMVQVGRIGEDATILKVGQDLRKYSL
ncbi:MAG: hypothetical protein ACLQU2_22565 [Candidatus Binataceae bacterium]